MPDYLRFVKGVVDAHDLSLNVSREILQQDRQIQIDPPAPGQEGAVHGQGPDGRQRRRATRTFWTRVRPRPSRKGCSATPTTATPILDISSFASTHDADEPTTLAAYVERMKDGQERHLLHDRRVPADHRELAAPGGVPGQGVRGAAAHRPGRRGVGRARSASSTASSCSRSPRARSTSTPTRRRSRPRPSASSSSRSSPRLLTWLRTTLTEQRQGGPAVLPADHLTGLPRRRRPRRTPDAGEDVPGDGPGDPPRSSASSSSTPAPAGRRPAHGPRAGRRHRGADRDRRAALRHGAARRGRRAGDPARFARLLADRLARTL